MTASRLLENFQSKLSEAEDNIIRATVALHHAQRAKAYWERAIAHAKGGSDFHGEVPALQSAVKGAVMA